MKELFPAGIEDQPKRRYSWPWFVLAAVLLGILLAILWMSQEIRRTKRNRDLNAPVSTGLKQVQVSFWARDIIVQTL